MTKALVSIFHWVCGYLVFIIGGTILLLASCLPFEQLRYRVATYLCRTLVWASGIRLRMEGNYPTDQSCIYMANHASFMDMFILGAIMKGKFTGVVAAELMGHPFLYLVLKRFGAIPIRRRDRDAAIAAIKVAEDRLRRGFQVGILPEGTRTVTGKMGPLKKGGFHMALNTGAPILPIGIEGAFRFKPKTTWMLRPGPVTIRIGTPIPAERYQQMTMEQTMEEVRQHLLVLTGEVAAT